MVKKNESAEKPAPKTRKATKKAVEPELVESPVETPVEAKKPTRSRKPKAEEKETEVQVLVPVSATSLLFQAPDLPTPTVDPKRGRIVDAPAEDGETHLRRRTRRRAGEDTPGDVPPNSVVKVRTPREPKEPSNEPQKVRGSTRLEAKRQRRRDGRDAGRRRSVITESEFLARREAVDRTMVVRSKDGSRSASLKTKFLLSTMSPNRLRHR